MNQNNEQLIIYILPTAYYYGTQHAELYGKPIKKKNNTHIPEITFFMGGINYPP